MTREEALAILDTIPTIGEQVDALEMAIEALEGHKASETEVLRKIQQECRQKLTCTGCRFQGRDEFGFTLCKMHCPECWIIDEQEAAAEEEKRVLYRCDPEKNIECTKEACRWACRMTDKKEYSTDGRALSYEEQLEEQRIADEYAEKAGILKQEAAADE